MAQYRAESWQRSNGGQAAVVTDRRGLSPEERRGSLGVRFMCACICAQCSRRLGTVGMSLVACFFYLRSEQSPKETHAISCGGKASEAPIARGTHLQGHRDVVAECTA